MTDPAAKPWLMLWRWHALMGILCAPVLATLASTGLIYLYQPEIDAVLLGIPRVAAPSASSAGGSLAERHSANQAQPSRRSALPASSALPAGSAFPASSALPAGSTITEVLVHGGDRCLEVRLKRADGAPASAFVDPGTGAVVAVIADDARLTDWAIRIHRNLLIGTTGRLIAEFAAGWGLLLALSGLIWWWRARRTLMLASWHGWIGLAGAAPLLFLTLSALPWTEVWGTIHNRLVAALDGQSGTPSWMHRPKSISGLPSSLDYVGAMAKAQELGLPPPFAIRAPRTADGTWRLSTPMGHPPESTRTIWLDTGDGRLVDERSPADRGRFATPAAYGVSIHMGRYFGELNRLLCALGCVTAVLLAITGSWLAARSGFAALRRGGQPAPWWGVALVLVLLPLSAIPLLIDRLWPRRKADGIPKTN